MIRPLLHSASNYGVIVRKSKLPYLEAWQLGSTFLQPQKIAGEILLLFSNLREVDHEAYKDKFVLRGSDAGDYIRVSLFGK